MEIKLINYGSIYGEDKGTGYAGQTWGVYGLCPTINTCEGGNRQPLVIRMVKDVCSDSSNERKVRSGRKHKPKVGSTE